MSQQGGHFPQLGSMPFLPFGAGPGSVVGSELGGGNFMGGAPPSMAFPATQSMYGMGMSGAGAPMANMGMFGGSGQGAGGSQAGFSASMVPPMGMQQRPMSTFSLATSVNPFAGPSMNPNPSDDELINALRNYLSTQDLMSVTKKSVLLLAGLYFRFDLPYS